MRFGLRMLQMFPGTVGMSQGALVAYNDFEGARVVWWTEPDSPGSVCSRASVRGSVALGVMLLGEKGDQSDV